MLLQKVVLIGLRQARAEGPRPGHSEARQAPRRPMSRIGILYKIEEMLHDKTPEEKYEERQKQSRPVMDAMFEWLHTMEDSVDRSSLIGDAILYTLNQEVYLRRYLEDGHLSIDNNSAERALKNFAVGRRNWLFAKSVRGADASALVYSITETALLNHLKPYAYLTYILDELRKMVSPSTLKWLKSEMIATWLPSATCAPT